MGGPDTRCPDSGSEWRDGELGGEPACWAHMLDEEGRIGRGTWAARPRQAEGGLERTLEESGSARNELAEGADREEMLRAGFGGEF